MDFNNALIAGAGGLIVGLVLGYAMGGGSGDAALEAQLAKTEEVAAMVETLSADVAGLGERLGGIEGVVTAQSEGLQGLGGRIDGIGASVAGTVDQLGGGVSEALRSQLEGLRGEVLSLMAAGAGSGGGGSEAAGAASGTALMPGATAVLAEGQLRVFLSSANSRAETANVAINGQTLVPLEVGRPFDAGGCAVELTGFDPAGVAMIDGHC